MSDGEALVRVVRRVVERFGLGAVLGSPEPLAEAWSNDVLAVRTASGRYVVKVFSRDLDTLRRTGLAVEAAALATGRIPLAEPVPLPGGARLDPRSWLTEVDDSGRPRWARCHAWVEGTPATRAGPTPAIADEVGRSLGILHARRLPGGDTSQLEPVDLARWHRAVSAAAAAGTDWAVGLAELTPLVEELAVRVEELRAERRPMRLSHRDVDPKNAVLRDDGRVVLTDWDYAGPVLAEVELVVAACSFAGGSLAADERLLRAFVAAYRSTGGDAGPADALAMRTESAADVGWLLRNVEGCLRPGDDAVVRRRFAVELIGSFAARLAAADRWAELVADG